VATRSLTSRRFMSPHHLNPLDAVIVHKYLRAKRSVGTQWGTFKMVCMRPCHRITSPPVLSNHPNLSCHSFTGNTCTCAGRRTHMGTGRTACARSQATSTWRRRVCRYSARPNRDVLSRSMPLRDVIVFDNSLNQIHGNEFNCAQQTYLHESLAALNSSPMRKFEVL
jgi:hypothetical protein